MSSSSESLPAVAALDRIDRELLRRLQDNGRITVSQLAREVNLTVTPCFDRVRRLEASGYIRGYFADLDPERLGLHVLAYVTVIVSRTAPDVLERISASVRDLDDVLECHIVGGGVDYVMKVRVRDMQAFRALLAERISSIPGVQHTQTYFVVEEVKTGHALVVPR